MEVTQKMRKQDDSRGKTNMETLTDKIITSTKDAARKLARKKHKQKNTEQDIY